MLFSGKKILYLSLYENGQKTSSAGFVRMQQSGDNYKLEVCVKKASSISGSYPVNLTFGENEALSMGSITLFKGEGTYDRSFYCSGKQMMLCGKNIIIDTVSGIEIKIKDGMSVKGGDTEGAAEDKVKTAAGTGMSGRTEAAGKSEPWGRTGTSEDKTEAAGKPESWGRSGATGDRERLADKTVASDKPETESMKAAGSRTDKITKSGDILESGDKQFQGDNLHSADMEFMRIPTDFIRPERQERTEEIFSGDKWQQLLNKFKKVHPYGDERIYITIEPKDFVLLRYEYQKLVNNSFLLHGFYNYTHMILGKDKEIGNEGNSCFYLGVPGVYFEREKMVAVMFGFEAFECGGQVEVGKFGYYLRKVEL